MARRTESFDLIVIGAGAAGMMCAMTAGARGKRVVLVDHAEEPGKKILISGGGRCNFTNLHCAPDRFISANPDFCISALARFTPGDFIALIEKHGIAYHEKTLGQLFCDGPAREVVRMLVAECRAAGVVLRLAQTVGEVAKSDRFRVTTNDAALEAPALALATGGLSIPKLGASDFTYRVARRFGLDLIAPRPGLVPLTFADETLALMRPLTGIACPARVRAEGGPAFDEALLFTHRGLSGPAVLQASSYWRGGRFIDIDLLPGADAKAFLIEQKRTRPRGSPKTALNDVLPKRLAEAMAADLPDRPLGDIADRDLARLAARLNQWRLMPSGSEGYAKAEVTVGGVDTAGLSSRGMEARAVPGLFVIGEALDVTGWLGGYNFQWAWASGFAAGSAAAG